MFSESKASMVGGTLVLLALSAPLYVQAQVTQPAARPAAQVGVLNEAELRNTISLSRLLDMQARPRVGGDRELGIEHVLIDQSGKAVAIVVEGGGVFGQKLYRIPWNEVQFAPDMGYVTVPLTQQNANQYLYEERVATGPTVFRMSRIEGVVNLRTGERFGQLQDMLAKRTGEITAVLVDADFGPGGIVAIPFQAAAFNFDRNIYAAPFDRDYVAGLRPFNYRAYNIVAPRRPTATGATGAAEGRGVAGEERRERRARPAGQVRG